MEGQVIYTLEPTALFLEGLSSPWAEKTHGHNEFLEHDVVGVQATNTAGGRTEWAWGPGKTPGLKLDCMS